MGKETLKKKKNKKRKKRSEREKSLWVSESAAFLFEKGWFGGGELGEWEEVNIMVGFVLCCFVWCWALEGTVVCFLCVYSIYMLCLSSLSHSVYFLLFCYLGNVILIINHMPTYMHSFIYISCNSSHTHIILLLCVCVFVVTK